MLFVFHVYQLLILLLLFVYIKKKMWYDCQWDNSSQETKMTQKLTTIGHRTAFNNEQSPFRIAWSVLCDIHLTWLGTYTKWMCLYYLSFLLVCLVYATFCGSLFRCTFKDPGIMLLSIIWHYVLFDDKFNNNLNVKRHNYSIRVVVLILNFNENLFWNQRILKSTNDGLRITLKLH